MPAFESPPASAAPNGRDLLRALVARLNADRAGDHDIRRLADRIEATAEGSSIDCHHDAERGWWSLQAQAAAEPSGCQAKLSRLEGGRWRLWLSGVGADAGQLSAPCASALQFVEALRVGSDDPQAIAREVAERTSAHITLEAGRLTVTGPAGRRCRGLLATDEDGLPTLFLLDGDAWTGVPSHVRAVEDEA